LVKGLILGAGGFPDQETADDEGIDVVEKISWWKYKEPTESQQYTTPWHRPGDYAENDAIGITEVLILCLFPTSSKERHVKGTPDWASNRRFWLRQGYARQVEGNQG
jgi:hypothetical protein